MMSETGREKANSVRGEKAPGLLSRMELERENEQLRHQVEQLNSLHEIGRLITSALDLDKVLTRVVEAAVFITGAEEGSLMLLDERTNELYVRAHKGLGEKFARGLRLRVEDSIAGEAVETGRIRRLTSRDRLLKIVTGYIVSSILYVPLSIGGKVIGVLSVDNQTHDRPFTEEDEHLLSVLADYAAIAIENARLIVGLAETTQVLAGLHRTGRSMVSSWALYKVLSQIAGSAYELLWADLVVLYEYDERRDDVVVPPIIQGEVRTPEVLYDRGSVIPHGQSAVFKMIRRGQPFYAPNAERDWAQAGLISLPEKTTGEVFITREGIVSSAGIPLIASDETVGIMFVNYRSHHPFTDEEREIIEIFANQAAIAIQNARLMQDKERRIEELAYLVDISRIMTASPTELKDVLRRIAENASKVVEADYALVLPYDSKAERFQDDLVTVSGASEQITLAIQASMAGGMSAEVMKKGIVVVMDVQDVEKYPFIRRDSQSFVMQAHVQSIAGVRLQVGQEPVGVLYAESCTPRHFSEDELQALQLFANQAAIAIQNARLFETVQRHAQELSALYHLSLDITRQLEVKPLLETIVQRATGLSGANGGGLLLRHPKREAMEMVVTYKLPIILGWEFEFGQGLVGRVAQSGQPMIVNDYHAWEGRDWRFDEESYQHLFKAVAGVPLKQDDMVIGVLMVSDTDEDRVFEDSDVKLLERFAAQAVIAIANARLYEQMQQAHREREEMLEQLLQQEKMASLGILSAGIAHEINNPLNNILLAAEDAFKTGNKELREKRLQQIMEESERAGNIVKNLSDFARRSTSQEKALIDINETMERALALCGNEISIHHIDVHKNLSPMLPNALANQDQILTVSINIITNATQAMPNGGELTVETSLDDVHSNIIVKFADNGPGIPEDQLEKIFNPFFTTKIGTGLGLGLAMSRRIVEDHRGTIEAQSEEGKGATFTIFLPVEIPVELPAEPSIVKPLEEPMVRPTERLEEKEGAGWKRKLRYWWQRTRK